MSDQTLDALHALQTRGVNGAEELLELATPEQILANCKRWDAQPGVTPGLLVHWIREQDFPTEPPPQPSPADRLHARFDQYAAQFPKGTAIQSPHYHAVPIENPPPGARTWDRIRHETCPGTVTITGHNYPFIAAECDTCRYDCATPVGALHTLEVAG